MQSCVVKDELRALGAQAKLLSSLGLHHVGTSLRTKENELWSPLEPCIYSN